MEANQALRVRYHIFPGKPGPRFCEGLFKTYFDYWFTYWSQLLKDIKSGDVLTPDEFFRQDFVTCLELDGEIIGTICINSFNRSCYLDRHSFFNTFTPEFWEYMDAHGVKTFYSVQWFMVNPKFGPRETGINFAALLVGLGQEIYKRLGARDAAMIAMSRTDISASNTARKFGWHTVGPKGIILHNVPCDQLALLGDPKPHRNALVNDLIDFYWSRRQVHDRGYESLTPTVYESPRENLLKVL